MQKCFHIAKNNNAFFAYLITKCRRKQQKDSVRHCKELEDAKRLEAEEEQLIVQNPQNLKCFFPHNANANRNRKIKIIQTITLKQEPQPSSSSSKILPIPLNIHPMRPPPVKIASPTIIIPMIANISIYNQVK